MVGVTGTNGKTTTAFLVRHILEAAGIRTGLLGTVVSIVGGQEREVERTTPEAVDLQATFREMLEGGDAACAMEVSSHALSLHRADAIHFACAAFTNLTQDHLDFHGTSRSTSAPSESCSRSGAGARTAVAVINLDDSFGRDACRGARGRRAHARPDVRHRRRCRLHGPRRELRRSRRELHLHGARRQRRGDDAAAGLFNVYNALGALAAAGALDVPLADAAAALREAPGVPGRFEPVDEGQAFTVLVDYAHTPDSVENVLDAGREVLRKEGGGRLICVLGAGGDRDREKRPLMGAIARRYADVVVFTSDNPRSEDPNAIIADIVRGAHEIAPALGPNLSTWRSRPDRRKAIERAVELAQPGDMVIIAGKGHEQGQEFEDGRKIPFDDRDVAREALRARNAAPASARSMIELTTEEIAAACAGRVVAGSPDGGEHRPERAIVDSRMSAPGDLFFGIAGERADGGRFAERAIESGAWGVVVTSEHAARVAGAGAVVIEAADPGAALAGLARRWAQELAARGARTVGITGSVGKTSTKDILAALLRPVHGEHLHASAANFNTEIGLPLTLLEASGDTRMLVLEMAMRGMGQIRELAQIARPQVGVITNVGPVHLELVGTIERVAEAKAELIAELPNGGACVVPAAEEALRPHLRSDVRVADVRAPSRASRGRPRTFARSQQRCARAACASRSRRGPSGRRSTSASRRCTTSRTRWRRSAPVTRSGTRSGRWPREPARSRFRACAGSSSSWTEP